MRSLIIIGLLSLATSINAQKLIKQIAHDVCDCVEENLNADGKDLTEVVEWCMKQEIVKHQKALTKLLGEDVVNGENNKAAQDFGIEIGKLMINDCPFVFEAAVEQAKGKNDRASGYFEQAQAMADSGRYDMAVDIYTKAIDKDPLQFDFFNYRGIAYFKLGRYYKSISDFYRASEIDPENHLGLYNVAYTIYEIGDYQAALNVVDEAINTNKYYCASYNLKGLIYNELSKSDSAAIFYTQAYECDTTSLTYLYNIGYASYVSRDYEKALTHFKEAEERGYMTYDLILYTGNCYDQLKKYDEALEYHTRLIDNYEVDYVPYYNRGMVYLNMEQHYDALQDFVAAAALESSDPDVDEQMIYAYKGLKNYDKALSRCNKIIEAQTANASYRDLRAEIYTEMEEYQLALADYKMSLSLYPEDCTVHQKIGKIFEKLGDTLNASKHYQLASDMGCDKED